MNIFVTLCAIQQHSWKALEWIRQTLMRLYNQLSVLYIEYIKIYFQLNNTNSPQKLARICLNNHAALLHCVFVDGCGYTFTLDGQKSWWGATGSGGRTVKGAANEDET